MLSVRVSLCVVGHRSLCILHDNNALGAARVRDLNRLLHFSYEGDAPTLWLRN